MALVSLGLACQTRLSIDEVSADHRSLPFDFVIATREGVLEALRSGGASFQVGPAELEAFAAARQPTARGISYWHDYRIEGAVLADGWRDAVQTANDKYRFLWGRLTRLLADPAAPKRFVLSNTQNNLSEVAPGEAFDASFGLTAAFHAELVAALEALGARDFEVLFLHRTLAEAVAARRAIADPRFASRFGGVLELPTHTRFAASALAPSGPATGAAERACGRYEDGWIVEPSAPGVAVVYRDTGDGPVLAGELAEAMDGLLGVFTDAPGHVLRVVQEDRDLYFATGSWGSKIRWRSTRPGAG
jgi:hypothetical protein